ncbi:Exosome complex exonuclease [Hirschfeldia incana]|nr:Exosome complex exonuclease [Hirschfeldia incana]
MLRILGNVHHITRSNPCRFLRANHVLYHSSVDDSYKEALPCEWYKKKLPLLTKLTTSLREFDLVDGKLEDINGVIIYDDHIKQRMQAFKSLARIFIGSPPLQQKLKEHGRFFNKESEREPFVVSSLTKVCNFLDISAQQRKLVRSTVCSQVTQYRIWRGALEDVLNGLKEEVEHGETTRGGTKLGQQVILSCLKFLSESSVSYEDESSTSWMRPVPARYAKANASAKWEDVLDMVNDLRRYLEHDDFYHMEKLLSMKEGLLQIKDVFLDNTIGFREVRHQEHLVYRKLSKMLGSPSPCLFTLLMYFLYGRVRDIEVDLCGGFHKEKSGVFSLSLGRVLTSGDEKMLGRGIKQLDRALGLFEFVWETAGMKESINLQGHLWCLGAEERTITYRGKTFFLHDLSL